MNLVTAALNGGEDYELLFTVPLEKHDIVATIPGVRVIGHITKPELGCCMITRDDTEITLRAQGGILLPKNKNLFVPCVVCIFIFLNGKIRQYIW